MYMIPISIKGVITVKNMKNIIYGLILIALGVIFGLNALGYTQINIFFDGWWTLLIIVPCLLGLFRGVDVWGNLAGISVGTVMLLVCQDVLTLETVWKLILPVALVCVGVYLIFKDTFNSKAAKRIRELNNNAAASQKGAYAAFSSQNISFAGETFSGIDLTAAFGGVKCDLLYATVAQDCVINASATFGGIDIIMPPNVNVVVRSNSLFGGVSKKRSFPPIVGAPTVFVNARCLFAGVDIK